MKRITAIVLGLVLALPAAAEEVDRTVDAARDGHVHISNISGSVAVSGWSNTEVRVTGELGRSVEELIVERNGDKVTVKVKVPSEEQPRYQERPLYPGSGEASSVDVGTVSADIVVEGVLGEQRLEAVSGDIQTEADNADIAAGTVSGDVTIRGEGKDAETRTASVSGDLSLYRLAGNVEAESVSGDLIIDKGSFDRATFNVVNGDIIFESELRGGGRLSVEAVNGEVDLEFAGDISAQFDIDTFNGDIVNCFGPEPKRTSKYAPGMELSFTGGQG